MLKSKSLLLDPPTAPKAPTTQVVQIEDTIDERLGGPNSVSCGLVVQDRIGNLFSASTLTSFTLTSFNYQFLGGKKISLVLCRS